MVSLFINGTLNSIYCILSGREEFNKMLVKCLIQAQVVINGPTKEPLTLSLQMQQTLWLVSSGKYWNGCSGVGVSVP